MYTEDFPSCCGATIYHNFSGGINNFLLDKKTKEHLYLAITEKTQTKAIAAFKLAGWIPVRRFRSNRLTLWINPIAKKRKKLIKHKK